MPSRAPSPQADAFERLLRGDLPLLARAISLIEAGGETAAPLLSRLAGRQRAAQVIGFTGPPGVGKSTLINAYIKMLRERGQRVAVIAVDPSSPLSGGAVLGDRTRMGEHIADQGVFIRSVSARGHLGGLALAVPAIIDLLGAAGWPLILLETVGAGQSETEVMQHADVTVVLNAPGLGDDIQAMKAGLLEIADVLVVNKADLPLADRSTRHLQGMLALRAGAAGDVAVVQVSATQGQGLDQLDQAIRERFNMSKSGRPEQAASGHHR